MESHRDAPQSIIAHIARTLALDEKGQVQPYGAWGKQKQRGVSGHQLVQMGYGGVVYPPGSLHADTTNAELYLRLAPRADDLWFKCMAWLAGTPIRTANQRIGRPREIVGADTVCLKSVNVNQDFNRKQWLQLCKYYDVDSSQLVAQA